MQRTFRGLILSAAAACLVMPAIAAPGAQAAEKPQEWELVNPAGIIEKASVDPAKRIASLDGKTIALRWNSKHNGDVVLNRLAELLVGDSDLTLNFSGRGSLCVYFRRRVI